MDANDQSQHQKFRINLSKDLYTKPIRSVSRRACLNCRERKIKCDGVHVCRNCKQLDIPCIFVKSNRGGHRSKKKNESAQQQQNSSPPQSLQQQPLQSQSLQSQQLQPSQPSHHQQQQQLPLNDNKSLAASMSNTPVSASSSTTESNNLLQNPNQHQHPQSHQQLISSNQTPQLAHFDSQQPYHNIESSPPSPSQQNQSFPNQVQYSNNQQQSIQQPFEVHGSYFPEEEGRRAQIGELQTTIDQLQTRVNNLLPSSPQQITPEAALIRLWELKDNVSRELDLPTIEIVTHYIDLYYEYYHANHSFLLPKDMILTVISIHADVGLLHAMFSISCRFVTDEMCAKLSIHPYQRDTHYWVAQFEKHRKYLFPALLVKSLLLVGMAHSCLEVPDLEKGLEIMGEAVQICKTHNLEKKYFGTANDILNSEDILRNLPPKQLMLRESHIRTIWELWKFQLQLSVLYNNKNLIPFFNVNMCMPVDEYYFNNQFKNWDRKVVFWHDIDSDLLRLSAESKSGQTDSSEAQGMYYSQSLYIGCAVLLTLSFRMSDDFSPGLNVSLPERTKLLLANLPLTNHELVKGGPTLMAIGSISLSTVFFNRKKSVPFLYHHFKQLGSGYINGGDIFILSDEEIDKSFNTPKTVDAAKSYYQLLWNAHFLDFVVKDKDKEMLKHYPPLTACCFVTAMLALASEIVSLLKMAVMGTEIPRYETTPELTKYPDPGVYPFVPDESYSMWPVGVFGDLNKSKAVLARAISTIENQAVLWPFNRRFLNFTKIITDHIEHIEKQCKELKQRKQCA